VAARDLLEPAADVAAIRLGPDDPAVVETQRRLATVHREMGELTSARRVLEEALDGGLLALGDADPLILLISAELGAIADELGNKHEARRNLARVARFGPGVLGADHPYVRTSQRYLGMEVPPVRVTTTAPEPDWYPADAPAGSGAGAEGAGEVPPAVVPVEPGVYRPAPREDPAVVDEQVARDEQVASGRGAVWATDQTTVADRPPVPGRPGPIPVQPTGPTQPGTMPNRPGSVPTQPGAPAQPGMPAHPGVPNPPGMPGRPAGPVGPGTMPSQRPADGWYAAPAAPDRRAAAPYPEDPGATEPYDWAAPGAHWDGDRFAGPRRRSRGPLIAMALITLVVVAAGVVIGIVAFHRPSASGTASPATSSAPVHVAPTDVRLRDDGVSVTLTWADPTSGRVPFLIAGGRAGQAAQPFQTLPAGQTTYTLNALNPAVDYCFTVVAVYSTNELATSALVCTQRGGSVTPSPGR
jgi:hypothetical protein